MPDLVGLADRLATHGGRLGRPLHVLETVTSTNDEAKAGARGGAPHGALWVAETQTKGRGRQGRSWHSPPGENLLFSVLLRVKCPPARVPLISLVVGLAVRDAIARALGQEGPEGEGVVGVKWPNDVVIRDRANGNRWKKVAGILVESALSGGNVEHVVVGIGINVHTRVFPPELGAIATSLALFAQEDTGDPGAPPPDRAAILADVLAGLDHGVEHVAHRGIGLIHGRLTKHDVLAGREIESEDGSIRGLAAGIDLDGRLLVRGADDRLSRIASGEVRLFVR